MFSIILYLLIGLGAGSISGLIGIGGGVFILPALVYLVGLTQQQAQGTTLALLIPPIGLLAAWAYYKEGYVNIPVAIFVALGFMIGAWLGAKYAIGLPNDVLRKVFGTTLIFIALYMIFKK